MPCSILRLESSFRPTIYPLERRVMLDAGVLDAAFGDEGVAAIDATADMPAFTDAAVMSDGRIVMTGTSAADGTLTVIRLHADGTLDNSFGDGGRAVSQIGGNAQALSVAIQPDHKPVVVGSRGSDLFILRYQTNGKHDRTFGDGGLVRRRFGANVSSARDVAILDDGAILVAGNAVQANASTAAGLARFNPDGQLDSAFGSGGLVITKFNFGLTDAPSVFVDRMTLTPDDRIVLAGRFSTGALVPTPGDDAVAVMRFNPDGSPDTSFSGDGLALADFGVSGERAGGVSVDAQGRAVVSVTGIDAFAALRLLPNGRRDGAFGTSGLARASASSGDTADLLIDRAGNYVLAGSIQDQPRLARMLPDGTLDGAFGTDGITPPVPFTAPGALARVIESPDHTYVVGGTGGASPFPLAPSSFQLAKYFAGDLPAATLSARNIRAPLTGSHVFQVQWRDADGIDVSTIGPNNIRVSGPGSYARTATLVSIDDRAGATNVYARYKVAPPNAVTWTSADNGTYTVSILPNGVRNLDGTAAEAGVLGTFQVLIA